MTSCITKSTINLWDTLPKELCYIIWEYNVIPYLDELKDKNLVRNILLEKGITSIDWRRKRGMDYNDYRREDKWLGSMGWKETNPYMKQMCKENGIKGYSRLRRRELIIKLMSI
tara:strand:+ start:5548 stop:5889 length:342 start_codon:yes stop_codon:yes gene_type:complete